MSADRPRAGRRADDGPTREAEHARARGPAARAPAGRGMSTSPASLAAELLNLQRTAGNRGVEILLGPGRQLEFPLRRRLEARVGTDLGDVRLHSGAGAAQVASALGARAFTFGRHIGLAAGELGLDRARGERLLTHEAAHVAQQGRGPASRSAAEADARAVARGASAVHSGAPSNAVLLADTATETEREPVGSEPVVDDSVWTVDDEETLLSFRVGDQLFLLSGYPAIMRVPPRQAMEVREIFGVPAVGAAGSAVVSTSRGRALMIDVGSGIATSGRTEVTAAIYLNQLSALLARMGVSEITDVYVSHGHADHGNRLYDTVVTYNIQASNVVVPDFQVPWAGVLRRLWQRLAQSDEGRALGYDKVQPGARLFTGNPTAQVYRARLETGDVLLEFYADGEAVRELAAMKPGQRPGELLDTATALILISQRGTPFRMAVLGDLRGRDIHALRVKMDTEKPGSFARIFAGVEVAGGMQHHLGVVSERADLAGIADILQVTALTQGRLTAVVQTDDVQMRPQLVEALNILGVDVTVALRGTEAQPSNVSVTNESAVSATGPAVGRSEAPEASRAAVQRIAAFRQRELTLAKFNRNLAQAGAVEDPIALQAQVAAARGNLEAAYGELQQLTIGRLRQSNAGRRATAGSMDAVRFDQTAIASRIARIMEPAPVEASLARSWGDFTVGELLDLLGNQRRTDKALFEMISADVESGRISQRAQQLIEIVTPAYVREVLGRPPKSEREAAEHLMQMSRQAELVRSVSTPPPGSTLPLATRGGVVALIALEAAQIGLDMAVSAKQSRAMQRHRAFGDFLWWRQKHASAPLTGVIAHTIEADEVITVTDDSGRMDHQQWTVLMDRAKDIDTLTLRPPQDEDSWSAFSSWVASHVRNFDDFQTYFREGDPPVSWKGNFETGKWSVRVSTEAGLIDPGYHFEESERLTKIMNPTARRVIIGTEAALERTWARRGEPLPEGPTSIGRVERTPARVPGVSPLEELRPTRRAHFAKDADHRLFSVAAHREIVEPRDWPSKTPPSLFVFDNEGGPPGFVLVGGADYSTYVAIRSAWTYEYTAVVLIPRDTGLVFRSPALSPEEDAALRAAVETPGLAEFIKHPETDKDYEAEVRYMQSTPNDGAVALARLEDLEFEP